VDRAARAETADGLCRAAYEVAGAPMSGCALVAVGGYGRRELAPYSDLDVVLVHRDDLDIGDAAEKVWYPIWDSGARLDHSVRSASQMFEQADADLRVALGLLDLRHVAGDTDVTVRLRSEVLAHWRRGARERLPELRELVRKRHEVVGELAHLSVPDLKEAEGGLRDATVLGALVATWLVDVPHVELDRSRRSLLDLRDALHEVAGRATDRIAPEHWDPLATRLGLEDGSTAQRHVRELGRRVTHLSRLTWRRADGAVSGRTSARGVRRPALAPLDGGIAVSGTEVVLTRDARPREDPTLLLRAAAVAAEHEAELAPATAARLAAECPELPDPWPPAARQALVRLLAAGPGLLPVWETLEETGSLASFLPEWERIRLLPHASEVHRFTVDRHAVETCRQASALIRGVARPDVLLLAALLHDIGKGGLTEHSLAGEPVARAVATRMGYGERSADLVARLVRHHLLLARTATTRDPDDPATAYSIADALGDAETLALLLALTEADARATAPKAWSSWRARLVRTLASRTASVLGDASTPSAEPAWVSVPAEVRRGGVAVTVSSADGGDRVTVVAPDRIGLLADAAGLFALQRVSVRSARAWSQDGVGVSVWEVAEERLDERVLRQRFEAIATGRLDPDARWTADRSAVGPTVVVRPEASAQATVLEVRTQDRPGVVRRVCSALAALDLAVRSAHVDTLGPQAVDVFYVQEPAAGALTDARAADAAHAVRAALSG
jgi:[protein-PII] uridylyltransferase